MNCTFGSVGDANAEKLIILQNLLSLRNNSLVPLNTTLQFFDNQEDDYLQYFSFVSSGVTYNIEIRTDSYVEWETGSYRLNPPESILGNIDARSKSDDQINLENNSNLTKTHTPYTVPLDLPSSDLYGRTYSFLNSGKESNFIETNSTNETGSAFNSKYSKKISDSPNGLISLAVISWEEVYLNLSITKIGSPNLVKTAKVLLGKGSLSLKPKCKISINSNRNKPVSIGFQHSNLFRDYSQGGITYSFLQTLMSKSDTDLAISLISNSDLLSFLNKNLNTEDLVLNFQGCTPGVEK